MDSDLDLHIDLGTGSVEGRVVDAETGQGMAGLEVKASGEVIVTHTSIWFETITDAAGGFRLGPMIEGLWQLFARADEEVIASERVTVSRGTTVPATLRVGGAQGLRVRVATDSGRLPEFVQLTLRDDNGESVGHGNAQLNEAGEGWWRDAPEGRWLLWAGNGYGWIGTPVEIPGEPVAPRFPLVGSLRIEVPALMIETEVRAELAVELQGEGRADLPVTRRAALTEDRRWFYLDGLQPRLWWSVVVTTDDGRVWTGQVEIRSEPRSELVLQPWCPVRTVRRPTAQTVRSIVRTAPNRRRQLDHSTC